METRGDRGPDARRFPPRLRHGREVGHDEGRRSRGRHRRRGHRGRPGGRGLGRHLADRSDGGPRSCPATRRRPIETVRRDLSRPARLRETVGPFDIVLGALPGFLGYDALRAVIEAGKDCCDITFMPEDARDLDELAREQRRDGHRRLRRRARAEQPAGGHAVARTRRARPSSRSTWAGCRRAAAGRYEYKAAFSPIDVIEEYTRPARYVEDGAAASRGRRSPIASSSSSPASARSRRSTPTACAAWPTPSTCPDMKEKTLRYPGHAQLMACFREAGLFGTESGRRRRRGGHRD